MGRTLKAWLRIFVVSFRSNSISPSPVQTRAEPTAIPVGPAFQDSETWDGFVSVASSRNFTRKPRGMGLPLGRSQAARASRLRSLFVANVLKTTLGVAAARLRLARLIRSQ